MQYLRAIARARNCPCTRRSREVDRFRYLAGAWIAAKFRTRIICELEIKSGFIRAARGSRYGHLATYRDNLLEHVAVKARLTERHSPGRVDPPSSHPAAARPV